MVSMVVGLVSYNSSGEQAEVREIEIDLHRSGSLGRLVPRHAAVKPVRMALLYR